MIVKFLTTLETSVTSVARVYTLKIKNPIIKLGIVHH